MSVQEKEQMYLSRLRGFLAGGDDLSPEAVEELNRLAAELGITEAQSSRLMSAAIDSLQPGTADDMDEPPEGRSSKGLSLAINVNRFYMAGMDGVVHIRLENLDDGAYDSVDVIASGPLLGRTEKLSYQFASCGSEQDLLEVRPDRPGQKIVKFFVDARQGDSIRSYDAKCDLPVFANNQDLREVLQQASNMGNVSAGTGKIMGNSIHSNIQIMVDQGRIRDANDLMMEYGKLPPCFEHLELRYRPERSEDLTTAWRQRSRAKRIVEPARGSLADAASLLIESKGRPANIVLLARERLVLGKNRRNDIVTRICPRSPVNDTLSNRMSRDHCVVELTDKGLFVKDGGSVNGTSVDGKQVDANGVEIGRRGGELDLAGVLKLGVRVIEQGDRKTIAAYEKLVGDEAGCLWDMAGKTGLTSVMVDRLDSLGSQGEKGCERYCLVYRLATIGSDRECTLSIADKGLESMHAALVYLRDRFYLENLSNVADVIVNDRTLSKNELIPLSFGDCIRIGRLEMEYAQKCQLFVDV